MAELNDPEDIQEGKGEQQSSPNVRTALIQGLTFGIKAVQYAEIGGLAMFEGDIVLGTDEEVQRRTEELRATSSGAIASAVMITGAQFRWPNCTIPYNIDPALPNQNRVTGAIAHWEANTGFRFVLRTAANASTFPDFVTFRPSTGCSSSVGKQGGQQFVNLGTGCTMGNAIHEIGHVVGLWHEQSREDRDSFVTIHWNKIQNGFVHNFDQHITDGDDVGPYDYGSIMHYPRDAFSVDGSDTITPIQAGASIGQRTALSAGDIAAANSLCPVVPPKRPITDTIKEKVKDIRLDTRKEIILDTRKEQVLDTVKERVLDTRKEQIETIKEGARDPINPGGTVTNPPVGRIGVGALPFAVATNRQAPKQQGDTDEAASDIQELDAHLQEIAEELALNDASKEALQQQYDEVAALLEQAVKEQESKGSAS